MADDFPDVPAKTGNPFGVKDSTANEYRKKLVKLEKDGFTDFHKDAARLITHLKTLSESTQKGYLSAVKYALQKDEVPGIIQNRINELYKNQNKRDEEQKPTEKQEENLVPWNDIAEKAKLYEGSDDDKLIAALYTLQAPVRADYGQMAVHIETVGKEGNELVIKGRKTSYFMFRDYKTSSTYGNVKVPVSPELFDVLIADGVAERNTLLRFPRTPERLADRVRTIFSKVTGKNVGIDILRHSYIMQHFPKMTTLPQKNELARRMLHSRDRQEKYNLVG